MQEYLTLANLVASLIVVISAWWLTHLYALRRRRGKAICLGLVSLTMASTLAMRVMHITPDVGALIAKLSVAGMLIYFAIKDERQPR